MKYVFALSFIMALYLKFQHAPLCQVFANRFTYEKKLGLHFGKELLTERELANFEDHYE